jgi:hypothetical protein
MTESRSDSNAEIETFTSRRSGGEAKVEIAFYPHVVPLAVVPPKNRSKRKSPRPAPTRGEESRTQEFDALIHTAAKEAGRDNRLFCELLDQRGVPTPRDWRVGSWVEAYRKPALRSAIRGAKRRSLA